MKKRLLAFALASTMLFTSFNVAYAEDAAVADDIVIAEETAEDEAVADEAVADDVVESDSAVVDDTSSSGGGGSAEIADVEDEEVEDLAAEAGPDYVHEAVAPWQATAFGDIANQEKLGTYYKSDGSIGPKAQIDGDDGTKVDAFEIQGTGEGDAMTVHMRAGTKAKPTGKVSGSADGSAGTTGGAYYYQQIASDMDFTLSAKAHVNSVLNTDNQVAFGIMFRDELLPDRSYSEGNMLVPPTDPNYNTGATYGSEVTAGRFRMAAKLCDGWVREPGRKMKYSPFQNEGGTVPKEGTDVSITLKKSGDVFIFTVDGHKTTFDGSALDYNGDNAIDKDYNYVGLFASRAVDLTWSEISLTPDVPAKSIEVTPPTKTLYNVDEPFDPTGMVIKATYPGVNGAPDTTAEIDINDTDAYSILGFDDQDNKSFSSVGTKTLTVVVGNGRATFNVDVQALKVDRLELTDVPAKAEYYIDGTFDPFGIAATAYVNDGSTRNLNNVKTDEGKYSNYKFVMDGKVIDTNTVFTAADAGVKTIQVSYRDDDKNLDDNDVFAEFQVTINNKKPIGLDVAAAPTITTYYIGQEFNPGGLIVQAVYQNADGTVERHVLTPAEYTLSGFNSETANPQLPITVTFKANEALTTVFNVGIYVAVPSMTVVDIYPRTSYNIGEAFSAENFKLSILYTDGSSKEITKDVLYYKGKDGYYSLATSDPASMAPVDENTALNQDFYIDLTDFDSSAASTQSQIIKLVVNKGLYPNCKDVEIPITILEADKYLWRADMLGALDQGGDDGASITVTKADGTKQASYKKTLNTDPQIMENGVLPDVQEVNIMTTRKSGKIATDHDGIAYYYTVMDGSKNFEISADVLVNAYLIDRSEMDPVKDKDQVEKYDNAIKEGKTPDEAKDMARDGQEGFGIMAKDIIQLAGGVDGNTYLGGTAKDAVVPENAAQIYYVFDRNNDFVDYAYDVQSAEVAKANAGEGAWYMKKAAALYEAFALGMPIRATDGTVYDIQEVDLNKAFQTNMVLAGAITEGSWPKDPKANSYQKNAEMNRINLMVRTGVSSTTGGGSSGKVYVDSTTKHLPVKGDKYHITLRKFKTGYQISTAEYIKDENGDVTNQLGETVTKYGYDSVLNSSGMLRSIDSNNYYVGFFASRRADITVSNIRLKETNPDTDPDIAGGEVKTNSPNISVKSDLSTFMSNYTLRFKPNGDAKYSGMATVTYEGKQIWEGSVNSNSTTGVNVRLKENDINKFVITFYPNTSDPTFTNYNTVVKKFYVTHNDRLGSGEIYIAPDGKATGLGTKDDPVDLETAIQFMRSGATGILADGVYNLRNDDIGKIDIKNTQSGFPWAPITLKADEGANPIIDLQAKYEGFYCDADYWIFSGLTVTNSVGNGKAFNLAGNHCIVEYCTFHDNNDTGFQISRISGDDQIIEDWPSYNVVRHCEAFNNFDPSKNNADGFAAKLTVGYGNVFEDCISHHNADDGWDCYTKLGTGAIGASVLENCISYRQQHSLNPDGTDTLSANGSGGNGFKLGGEDIFVKHYVKDCITFENSEGNGVDTNNNPAVKIRNVISMDNNHNFGLYGNPTTSLTVDGSSTSPEGKVYKYDYDLKGAVSIQTTASRAENIYGWNAEGTENYANIRVVDDPSNYLIRGYQVDAEGNPVLSGGKKVDDFRSLNSEGKELDTNAMFVSLDKTTSQDSMQRYHRNADGSFDHGDFLKLRKEYVHDPADIVVLPTLDSNGNVGPSTESTEATTSGGTITPSTPSGGGGGGGGGAKLTVKEATTQATTAEEATDEPSKGSVITKDVKVTIGASEIVVGDQTIPVDASAYIQKESSSTLVPLRFVAIAILGGDVADADSSSIVAWDAQAKAATITAGEDTIVFTAGSSDMVINGETTTMDNGVKAEIVDGRMYVPFRALGQALGVAVAWDADTKTASYIAPTPEEEPDVSDISVTKEQLANAAEVLDQLLSVSVEKAQSLSEEDAVVYAEKCDKLATIQQEVASDMTDEEVQAAYDILMDELAEYFRTELPEKVGTTEAVDAKADEIMDKLTAEAEAAEAAEDATEATTAAE